MHVDRTTMLIPIEPPWSGLELLILGACKKKHVKVRFLGKPGSSNSKEGRTINVLTDRLEGAAAFEIDVHWNSNTALGDDTIGFRVAQLIGQKLILRNYDEKPTRWMMLSPEFEICDVHVDEKLLNQQRCVCYYVA